MTISTVLLRETFYPQTLVETSDNIGGVTKAWTDGTAFRGRLSSIGSNEKMSNDKMILESTHKLFCNHQTISPISRIRNNDSTRYFQIKGIVNPSNSNHHLELYLREIDTNG